MEPSSGYADELFTSHAIDFITRKKDQAWFLYLAYNTPHGPVEAAKEDTAPLLGKFKEKNPEHPYNAMYAAMIQRQDKEIGRVLKSLDDLKLADNTLIIYTSGTTGRPKGAMLTHQNLLHNVESCRQVLKAVNHDRFVVLLPMFHSFMMTVGVLLPLMVGGSIVLVRSPAPDKSRF